MPQAIQFPSLTPISTRGASEYFTRYPSPDPKSNIVLGSGTGAAAAGKNAVIKGVH